MCACVCVCMCVHVCVCVVYLSLMAAGKSTLLRLLGGKNMVHRWTCATYLSCHHSFPICLSVSAGRA